MHFLGKVHTRRPLEQKSMHFSLITVRSPVGKHNQVAPPGEGVKLLTLLTEFSTGKLLTIEQFIFYIRKINCFSDLELLSKTRWKASKTLYVF